VIASHEEEQDHYDILESFKPNTRRDIQSFAWNFTDHPTGRSVGFKCSLPKSLFDPIPRNSNFYRGMYDVLTEKSPLPDASLDFSCLRAVKEPKHLLLVEHFRES